MRFRDGFLAFVLLVVATGCKPERKPGDIGNSLSTPAALLVTGTGANAVLLVSNANFQLEFNGGSVSAIDLSAVDEGSRLNLVDNVVASAVPLPSFVGPMALTPDGSRVLVSNRLSEGEGRTTPDHVFVLDAADFQNLSRIDADLEVGHDPFGIASVRLPPVGPGRPVRDRAFVANASDGSISVLNLTEGTFCNGVPAPCVDDPVSEPRASEVTFTEAGPESGLTFLGPGLAALLTPTDRWEVTFIEGEGVCPDPGNQEAVGYWRVEGSVSGVQRPHACTGFLYVSPVGITFEIDRELDENGDPIGGPPSQGDTFEFETFFGDFDPKSAIPLNRTIPGATVSGRGVGQIIHDRFRNRIYATSRLTNFVYVLDAADARFLGVFTIVTNVTGRDSRGIALSPDGSELYVVNRSPDALLVLDPDALEDSDRPQLVTDGVIGSIPLGRGASELVLSPDGLYGFVTAFEEDMLHIVDIRNRTPSGSTHIGDGPFAIRLSADGTRGYVAEYFSSAIDVIDTDPESPTFGEVITTIANENYVPDF